MLTVKFECEAAKRMLAAMPRKVEIAAQRALLKTAHAIKDAEKKEMERVFDRPTRWTLGAMKVKSTKKFEVEVGVLDPKTGRIDDGSITAGSGYYKRAQNYLGTQISGGKRGTKAMERRLQNLGRRILPPGWMVTPGQGARLDAYGNIYPGQIFQILSFFQVAEEFAGVTANMKQTGKDKLRLGTSKRLGTKRNVLGYDYFAVLPGARKGGIKQPGIYQRFFIHGGKAISVKPILIFIKTAKYQARFNFEKVARDTANSMMQAEFDKASFAIDVRQRMTITSEKSERRPGR